MSTDAWKKENTVQKNVRFTKSSGAIEALKKASKDKCIPESVYIRDAIMDKLIADGYLSAQSDE